jgi:hypothetical protein
MGMIGNTLANSIQAGGSALSLVSGAKALVMGVMGKTLPPGISVAGSQPTNLWDRTTAFLMGDPTSFLFDIPTTEDLTLTAQITDHYVEANYAIQDHVALEPVRITLVGNIAELVCKKSELEKYAEQILDRLQPWGVLSPQQSLSAQQTLAEALRLKNAINSAVKIGTDLYNDVTSGGEASPEKGAQRQAYSTLENMWKNRSVVSVETPWKTFPSMLIESISFSQDESTKDMSTITIVVKEFRVAETTTGIGLLKGRISSQASDIVDKGKVPGESILSRGFSSVVDSVTTMYQNMQAAGAE